MCINEEVVKFLSVLLQGRQDEVIFLVIANAVNNEASEAKRFYKNLSRFTRLALLVLQKQKMRNECKAGNKIHKFFTKKQFRHGLAFLKFKFIDCYEAHASRNDTKTRHDLTASILAMTIWKFAKVFLCRHCEDNRDEAIHKAKPQSKLHALPTLKQFLAMIQKFITKALLSHSF